MEKVQRDINGELDVGVFINLCRQEGIEFPTEVIRCLYKNVKNIRKMILKKGYKSELIILLRNFIPRKDFMKIHNSLKGIKVIIRKKSKLEK